jgi:hypothetical protein
VASITITIPDAVVQRVLDGMVPVAIEGETQAQSAKRLIIDYMKTTVRNTEADVARAAAAADVDADVSMS